MAHLLACFSELALLATWPKAATRFVGGGSVIAMARTGESLSQLPIVAPIFARWEACFKLPYALNSIWFVFPEQDFLLYIPYVHIEQR